MTEYIPFVQSQTDCQILASIYPDVSIVRLGRDAAAKLTSKLPDHVGLWIDAAIDGLDRWPKVQDYYQSYISEFVGYNCMVDPHFQAKPDKIVTRDFVNTILYSCFKLKPTWITVPQLPVGTGATRNKVNRALAEAAANWSLESGFTGKLILPFVMTHQEQINSKTARNPRLKLVEDCYHLSKAAGVWVVDSTLSDQDGSKTFEHKRFPALVALHEELNERLPNDAITVAGPYWGMNLVLWARGLVRHPAIGLGGSYQYYLPGGMVGKPNTRFALPPLRRWAIANEQLRTWLQSCLKVLPKEDSGAASLQELEKNFDKLLLDGRTQVANFYKWWIDKIAAVPTPGRSLALYQDLSSAYVFGKSLPDLPSVEGTGRKPSRVAKQFMLNCL